VPKLLKQRQAHEGVSDWIRIYTESLHALSGRHKDAPIAKQARRVLDDLAREALSLGRGNVWLPEPGAEGYYPTIGEIAYPDLRTALRKGARSQIKEAAWARARKTESPYTPPPQSTQNIPEHGLGARSFGEKKTLRSQLTALGMIDENGKWLIDPRGHTSEAAMARELMVAMPVAEGRYPEFLGRRVPGTLFRRERGSVLRWDEISPEDVQIGGGFSPMKFARVTSYAKFAPIREALPAWISESGGSHLSPRALKGLSQVTRGTMGLLGVKEMRTPRAGSYRRLRLKWARQGISPTEQQIREKLLTVAPNYTGLDLEMKAQKPRFLKKIMRASTGEGSPREQALGGLLNRGVENVNAGYKQLQQQLLQRRRGAGPAQYRIGAGMQYALVRKKTSHETVNVVMPQSSLGSQAASSVIGGAAGASAALLVDRIVKAIGKRVKRFALKPKEKVCFYAGFFEQLKEAGLPALSRGALMGLLDAVHQELGILPAITVDNIPIHRKSFDSRFERLGNMELRAKARRLAEHPLLQQEQDLLAQPNVSKQAIDAIRVKSAPYRKTLEELMKEVIHREA